MVFIWWNHLPVLPLILHLFTLLFVTFYPPLFCLLFSFCHLCYFRLPNATNTALIFRSLGSVNWNCCFTYHSRSFIYMFTFHLVEVSGHYPGLRHLGCPNSYAKNCSRADYSINQPFSQQTINLPLFWHLINLLSQYSSTNAKHQLVLAPKL